MGSRRLCTLLLVLLALFLAGGRPAVAQTVATTRHDCTYPTDGASVAGGLEAYKANALLSTWDRTARGNQPDPSQQQELEFQLSVKFSLLQLDKEEWLPLYFGYSQRSFWQFYDTGNSRPFRETNYNPELFVDWGATLLCGGPWGLVLGLAEHVSNGMSAPLSRSLWRAYLLPTYAFGDWRLGLKAMAYKRSTLDDNRDLRAYLGSFDALLDYPFVTRAELVGQRSWTLSLLLRRGDRTGCCSGQLDVGLRLRALNALPVLGRLVSDHVNPGLFLLLHAYSGYGESLIDYDRPVHTVGIGIAFR